MKELLYWSIDELMAEFNRRASQPAPDQAKYYDVDEALRLMLDERFDPTHFAIYTGFLRGLKANQSY